jgi:hypothetical protein
VQQLDTKIKDKIFGTNSSMTKYRPLQRELKVNDVAAQNFENFKT